MVLKKLRAIIGELPETSEKLSHGTPTWWGGKKTFANFHSGSYDEGREAVWIKAPDGAQEALIHEDPSRFYRPKYLGPSGWVGMRLDRKPNWDVVRELLIEGYRLVAPKRALAVLDDPSWGAAKKARKKTPATRKKATKKKAAEKREKKKR